MDEILQVVRDPLISPIFIALLSGALAYVVSRVAPLACKLLALIAASTALAGGLFIAVNQMDASFSADFAVLVKGVSFTVDLTPSTLGMVVLIGGAAFALLISVYSFRSMAGEYWEGKFYAYLIWALAGSCIVALAGNLLVLLVGWELVTLMLFLMLNQGRRDARSGAAKTYGMLGFADACLLLAVALLIASGGSAALKWPAEPLALGAAPLGATGYVVYVLILIAALAKAGAVPVHTWIPAAAKDAPTSVMAYLPAAMDKLLGIYLLAVLALRMFQPDWTMQVILMTVGAVTILAAVLMAMVQHNLKRLLSFHAVSQVGYMVLGIGTGTTIGVVGGLFHMINNAIYKSNLFLMSGTAGRATGSDELEDMGGLARYLPVTFGCALISAAAIYGVPPFNGFASKWMLYQGTLEVSRQNQVFAIVLVTMAVFGSALTLASFVKVIYSAFLSPAPKGAAYVKKPPRESFFLAAPMVVLAAACVLFGLWPQLITQNVLEPAVASLTTGSALATTEAGAVSTGPMGLWNPTQATWLILIGLVIGGGLVWVATRKGKVRVVRPFLAGELPAPSDDRFRVPGTHFYETISKLPVVGPLLKHGQAGAMDVYHWSGKHGNTFVQMLRSWHTGLISLYVAWVLLGLTVILVYLLLSAGT